MPISRPTDIRVRLILVAALPFRMPSDGRARASSARILRHAITCAGLWAPETAEAFEDFCHGLDHPVFDEWYALLIEMTKPEFVPCQLLDGYGNLEFPAAAHFTGCYLTAAGRELAETELAGHPEWANPDAQDSV